VDKPIKTKSQSITNLIRRSVVISGTSVFIIVFLISLYFNYKNVQSEVSKNFIKILETVAKLVAPSLAISDTGQTLQTLAWASDDNQYLAVISNDSNVLLKDYSLANSINSLFKEGVVTANCKQIILKKIEFKGKAYRVFCEPIIGKHTLFRVVNKPIKLGIIIGLDSYHTPLFYTSYFITLILISFITIFLTIFWIRMIFNNKLIRPLLILKEKISIVSQTPVDKTVNIGLIKQAPEEINEIQAAVDNLLHKLRDEFEQRIKYDKKAALYELATQIAHDIRSPLAAFREYLKSIVNLPENERVLIRKATQRIEDIANNLLTQHKNSIPTTTLTIEQPAELMAEVIAEKRAQFRRHEINYHSNQDSYCDFALVNQSLFKQTVSNLIDNAIEAVDLEGKIEIIQENESGKIKIIIKDNGCGIAKELLPKILIGGVTNKKQGSGIGLSSAKRNLENWQGDLIVDSTINVGTTVTLYLPVCPPPSWVTSSIYLASDSIIIIIDDDCSIHNLWKQRFANILQQNNIQLLNFHEPEIALTYHFEKDQKLIFLVDYEFIGYELNGIDLIKRLMSKGPCYLVTSHYSEHAISEKAEKLGIKIISKNFASYVNIKIVTQSPQYILIDDSKLLCETWELTAKFKQLSFEYFLSIAEARLKIFFYPKNTFIYIDSNVDKYIKGEEFAKLLAEVGFKNLFLCTGESKEKFAHCEWLKAVIDKNPPF